MQSRILEGIVLDLCPAVGRYRLVKKILQICLKFAVRLTRPSNKPSRFNTTHLFVETSNMSGYTRRAGGSQTKKIRHVRPNSILVNNFENIPTK